MRLADSGPSMGRGLNSSRRTGCTSSHFTTDDRLKPPSPERSATCQGPKRSSEDIGATNTVLVATFRIDGEIQHLGRAQPPPKTSPTFENHAVTGPGMMPRPTTAMAERASASSVVHARNGVTASAGTGRMYM